MQNPFDQIKANVCAGEQENEVKLPNLFLKSNYKIALEFCISARHTQNPCVYSFIVLRLLIVLLICRPKSIPNFREVEFFHFQEFLVLNGKFLS